MPSSPILASFFTSAPHLLSVSHSLLCSPLLTLFPSTFFSPPSSVLRTPRPCPQPPPTPPPNPPLHPLGLPRLLVSSLPRPTSDSSVCFTCPSTGFALRLPPTCPPPPQNACFSPFSPSLWASARPPPSQPPAPPSLQTARACCVWTRLRRVRRRTCWRSSTTSTTANTTFRTSGPSC